MSNLVQIRRSSSPVQEQSLEAPSLQLLAQEQPLAEPTLQSLAQEPSATSSLQSPAAERLAYVETYGCQMNVADTEMVLGMLAGAGYARTQDPARADVILINTCAVREKAEDRVYGRVAA